MLSREFSLSHESLTQLILSKFPNQVPKTLTVSPLPDEIVSMLYFWLSVDKLPVPFNPALTPASNGLGIIGFNSSNPLTSMTPTSTNSHNWIKLTSARHSLRHSDSEITNPPPQDLLDLYARSQSIPPSAMWLRPSPVVEKPIPPSAPTPTKGNESYQDCSKITGYVNTNQFY